MLLKTKVRFFVCILMAITANKISAADNLTANAGSNMVVCAGSPATLGGSPTASYGYPPYHYNWATSNGITFDTTANPVVQPIAPSWYFVTVTDSTGSTASSQILISTRNLPIVNITADTSSTCARTPVQLTGIITHESGCRLTSASSQNTLVTIGNGTVLQPGSYTGPPYIFGNFVKSSRQQMLYTATELLATLGGPQAIKGIGFDIPQFNSNDLIPNVVISMGCTSLDSLNYWQDGLQEVCSISALQPNSGWNDVALNNTFYWDGVSNIIVDICFYAPYTYGNQVNKAACTNTGFSSYLFEQSVYNINTDLCGVDTTPLVYNIRPNLQLSYATPVANNYTYAWLPDTGANAVPSATTINPIASPVQTTTYYFTATDNFGCMATDSVTINRPFTMLRDSMVTTNELCYGDSTATVCCYILGGQTPYQYQWNIGDTGLCITHLAAGTYHISIIDHNGCNLNDSATIFTPAKLQTTQVVQNVSCYGFCDGDIVLSTQGGTLPYSYQWSQNYFDQQLCPGIYSLTIVDANECTLLDTAIITQPHILTTDRVITNVYCNGDYNGVICLGVSGGTTPYSFHWSNFATGACNNSLPAGTYFVTVSDANGCSLTNTSIITQPPLLVTDSILLTNNSCNGADNGAICPAISGGTPPYSFSWSNHSNGACDNLLIAGRYFVTVSDANGCLLTDTATITQPPALIITITASTDTLQYDGTDTLVVHVTDGVKPYQYTWNTTTNNDSVLVVTQCGLYAVTVTDSNGCIIIDDYNLTTCITDTTVGINTIIHSGPYIYLYPNPATDQLTITSTLTGIQNISIIDITGQQVYHQSTQVAGNTTLDVSNLSAGVYNITITAAGQQYHNQFVKENVK